MKAAFHLALSGEFKEGCGAPYRACVAAGKDQHTTQ
jgi:hypothetical protein